MRAIIHLFLSLIFKYIHPYFSGVVVEFPAELDPGENSTALYEKRSHTATGAAFLLTYNVTSNVSNKAYAKVC